MSDRPPQPLKRKAHTLFLIPPGHVIPPGMPGPDRCGNSTVGVRRRAITGNPDRRGRTGCATPPLRRKRPVGSYTRRVVVVGRMRGVDDVETDAFGADSYTPFAPHDFATPLPHPKIPVIPGVSRVTPDRRGQA